MKRRNVSSGSPYEESIGFSRAVRIGHILAVAGTGPINPDGSSACPGDAYGQARRCLEIIQQAVQECGGQLSDVIRTRIMLTNIADWEEVGRAHGEFFGQIRPASTMVAVKALVRPEWLVEIEADAMIEATPDQP